jgi:hypothetical protein
MRKKNPPVQIPAASPQDLQKAKLAGRSDPSPYRRGHRPVPLDWVCTHHQDLACLACWYVFEALRLDREPQGIVDVPIPISAGDPSVESVLPTNTGVSPSLPEQIAQVYDKPLPLAPPIEIKMEEKKFVEAPQRLFYRRKSPPNYACPEFMDWFKKNAGILGDHMLPEDVALLLTRGEFHYEDFANANDSYPLTPWVQVQALPDVFRRRDLNKDKRIQLEEERERMKSEKSTSSLTGVERASHLKKCKRRIKAIDKELRAMARDWTKVRVEGSGRPAFWLYLPSCPTGSKQVDYLPFDRGQRLMTQRKFRAYAEFAFGKEPNDYKENWDHRMAALENGILRHAEKMGLLSDWVKDPTAAVEDTRWRDSDWDALFHEFGTPAASEVAKTGYGRRADGRVPDPTIRKAGVPKRHQPEG